MRILRVISSIDPRVGGPVEGARKIDFGLAQLGIEVEVVCLDEPSRLASFGNYPATVHPLGPSHLNYKYNSRLVGWIKENQSRFDVVIVNGIWQFHSFATWIALNKSGLPYVVFTHGMLDPWFKRSYPLKHLKKWLYWPWSDYKVLRDAAKVLFTSEEERRTARESFWLYKAKEKVVAYGTAEPPGERERLINEFLKEFPVLSGKRIVLYLSRIHEKKGCDLLIEAFGEEAKNDPSLYLVMAGPDQSGLKSTLVDMATRLGVNDRVLWPGMLQGDRKWGAFHAAEVFCLPSHQENFGIVVAEALACGTPVLISNRVNIFSEIVEDQAGFAAEDSVDGTRSLLKRWLALGEAEREAMRHHARNCFASRFRIDKVVTTLLQELKSVMRVAS